MNSLTRFANFLSTSSAQLSKITTSSAVTACVCSQQRRGFIRLRRSSYGLSSQESWRKSKSFKNSEGSLLWGTSQGKWIVTSLVIKADAEMVDVTFVRPDGSKIKTKGKIGDNMLDVVVNNNVDLDGYGACEGTLACSTCHLVFKKEDFDKIQEKLTDEEMDMLDMAYGLTDTSRLGCQVCLTKELDGVEVEVPAGVSDARN